LRVEPKAPLKDTALYGPVPLLETTATVDEDRGILTIFVVNRDQREVLKLNGDLRAFPGYHIEEHLVLTDEDVRATNTAKDPECVRPRSESDTKITDGRLRTVLPPLSWNVIRLGNEG
jgi:alpha-N-arabinofuranosidase